MYVKHIAAQRLQRMKRVQSLLNRLQLDAAPVSVCVPGTPAPKDTVIIVTGSYNPPTTAHLALLKQAQRYVRVHAAQQTIHVYAAFSKHTVDKEGVEVPLMLDRIILLQDILRRRLPRVGILLFNRGLYLHQASAMRHSFPKVKRLIFAMGFDKIVQIFDPRYYQDRDAALEELFKLAELLVFPRGSGGEKEVAELLNQPQNQRFARYVHSHAFDTIYKDISATHVREGAAGSAHAIPTESRRFMAETRAYKPPIVRPDGASLNVYGERVAYLRRHIGPVS